MRLLLFSNSTNAGEAYLEYAIKYIREFLGSKPVNALFIPYAGVTLTFDEYAKKVSARFNEIGHNIESIHLQKDPVKAVNDAEVIVVGGGNTFQLLKMNQDNRLIEAVRKKVLAGTPYIGWSAGSNMACPTIRTTNDMPIVEPAGFKAYELVKFQINPHYLDANPEGHAGETREARIQEFIEVNPGVYVVGLREGTMFLIENGKISLKGNKNARVFYKNSESKELSASDNFSFLL